MGSGLDDEGEYYESGVIQWWSDSSVLTKFGIILNVIGTVIFGVLFVAFGEDAGYAGLLFLPFWIIGSLLLIIRSLFRVYEAILFG